MFLRNDSAKAGWGNSGSRVFQQARSRIATDTPIYDENGFINADAAFSGRQGGTELLGKLTRAQWDDWKARFAPIVEELAGQALDEQAPQRAAEQAVQSVNTSFDNSQRGLDLSQSRLGLSMSPEEQKARERSLSLARASTATDAANNARSGTRDRQMEIMTGSASGGSLPIDPMSGG